MKKTIIFIIFLLVIGILSFSLFMRYGIRNPKNGFNRVFKTVTIGKPLVIDLPSRSFYFVGKPKPEINLYSSHDPLVLYTIRNSETNIRSVSLETSPDFNRKSNYIIMRNGPSSEIYVSNSVGSLEVFDRNVRSDYQIPFELADNCTPISNKAVIVRSLEKKGSENRIAFLKLALSKPMKEIKRYALPKHGDGYFGNDGILRFDNSHSRLIYTYSYFGEFLCLDTNLNLLYKGKTIDTISNPNLKLGVFKVRLKNGTLVDKITQTTPPGFVNIDFTTNDGLLYIIAKLKADNETYTDFKKRQPIDVYSLADGKYLYTFYIPKYNGFELKRFEITNKKILTIFDKHLVIYDLANK